MHQVIAARRLFDGNRILADHAVEIEDGRIRALRPARPEEALLEGLLAPAFLDLQVNGGGGAMVDGTTDLAALRHLCATHRRLGAAGILPTLITDTPQATAQVVAAGIAAAQADVPGFLGLHLEGPHLDPRRKGAHDPALIRPMGQDDLARLCEAARRLPALMVTLAPEAATPAQIAALSQAGAIVSLGHSDCDLDTARAAFAAGARCATHLFNAMSQMGHRQPGLVGAVLAGEGHAGLIADGIHVHPAAMRVALAARDSGIFLVTDCMAFAGTELTEMPLNGRRVLRHDGRLTLEDGTLAGADLTLAEAVGNLVRLVGLAPERALAMASAEPARLLGQDHRFGRLAPGHAAQMVLLDGDYRLLDVWSGEGWLNPARD
ncbi:N-acetylglucosamine-6-phosphate deacetylase [Paracoccus siganidrum]|uniref:N-acetylglucosamine-6-phosphate deacetylase n=1 Tax=Paracoccus siganidrum TaxID=1276757 RepID=A0A419A4E4_9RHOB|nr:N-acetylglucosamine-6-phosphate deacetylase [Paracoccus siganidrum]RJL08941.1 N-acetylglucosamine-6-phosphate deacetylase [Paracoccus siganidrum]RMC31109.1 N-acetylglucosamine-6-phosphate deacetylase [Paracoccus siganidrum]